MKAEDKARELVVFYYCLISGLNKEYVVANWDHLKLNTADDYFINAIRAASFVVDEILKSFKYFMYSRRMFKDVSENEAIDYWQQVKSHINQ